MSGRTGPCSSPCKAGIIRGWSSEKIGRWLRKLLLNEEMRRRLRSELWWPPQLSHPGVKTTFFRVNKRRAASIVVLSLGRCTWWQCHQYWAGPHGRTWLIPLRGMRKKVKDGEEAKKKNRKCDAGSKNSAGKKDPGSDLFCIFLAENYLYQLCRHRPPFTLLRADQMWINSWLRLTSTGGRWDRPQCDACTRTVSAVLFGSLQDVEAGWGLFSAHPAGVGEGQRT